MPVEADLAVTHAPVFHDIQQTGDDFWSGELRCTLKALTPLIVGNYQFDYQALSDEVKAAYQKLLGKRGLSASPAEDKKVFEPLCLPAQSGALPGRVLIAGESLKGMVRHALQALLSAPLERVQERVFSFRPNIHMVTAPNRKVDVLPALVISGGGWSKGDASRPNPVEVLLLNSLRDVCYVHPDAEAALPQRIRDLIEEAHDRRAARYADKNGRNALLLTQKESRQAAQKAHLTRGNILKLGKARNPLDIKGFLPVVNLNGIDLQARLNELFHQTHQGASGELRTRSARGYRLLLLRLPSESVSLTVPPDVLQGFYDSLEQLADDTAGHLRDHPLVAPGEVDAIARRLRDFRQRGLRPGDLVFLEIPQGASGPPAFMGHHFYFRKRYRDSIHRTKEPSYATKHLGGPLADLREILCPRPLEQDTGSTGGPKALSGARLLFGYVGTSQGTYRSTEPLTFGIGWNSEAQRRGRSDFAQLAGRIGINMAIEQGAPDRAERFLNQEHAYLVPLRPLGAPKPSAVEVYLTQDRLSRRDDLGTLCTYGDTAGDPSAGNLRGRKFYLHQPDAASDPECYELIKKSQPDWQSGQTVHLLGNQAAIARFVSAPGTEFRFTLRFRDLRSWELGALLFTLAADGALIQRLVAGLKMPHVPGLRQWLGRIPQWKPTGEQPLLALKLGHGRPLGLGSVAVRIDQIHRLRFDGRANPTLEECCVKEVQEQTVDKFAEKLRTCLEGVNLQRWAEAVLLPWLQVHRYAGRGRFDYQRGADGTVFSFHSQERKKHARGRKLAKDPRGAMPRPGGLKSLDDLDR